MKVKTYWIHVFLSVIFFALSITSFIIGDIFFGLWCLVFCAYFGIWAYNFYCAGKSLELIEELDTAANSCQELIAKTKSKLDVLDNLMKETEYEDQRKLGN